MFHKIGIAVKWCALIYSHAGGRNSGYMQPTGEFSKLSRIKR